MRSKSVSEISEICGVHRNAVYAAIYSGKLVASRCDYTGPGPKHYVISWPNLRNFIHKFGHLWWFE